MSERVTDAEAIAWFEGELELAERIRATATHPGSKESSARLVARCAALLALARDGQRWRERRPNGYAVLTPDGAHCCELREDAVAFMLAGRGPTDELREIFFGPAEPVTPSAERESSPEVVGHSWFQDAPSSDWRCLKCGARAPAPWDPSANTDCGAEGVTSEQEEPQDPEAWSGGFAANH